jgi:hypothetical protein
MWASSRQTAKRPATGYAHLVRETVVVQTTDKRSIRGIVTGDYSDAERSPTIVLSHAVDLRAVLSDGKPSTQEHPIPGDVTIPLGMIAAIQTGGSS